MIKLLKTGKEIKIKCNDLNKKGLQISVECEGFMIEEKEIAPEKVYFKLNELSEKILFRLTDEKIISWEEIKQF